MDIDYEIVNGVQYQQGGSRTASKITNMGFRRENVGLLKDILGRTQWEQGLQGRGVQQLVNIQELLPPGSRRMHPNEQETGQRWREIYVDK